MVMNLAMTMQAATMTFRVTKICAHSFKATRRERLLTTQRLVIRTSLVTLTMVVTRTHVMVVGSATVTNSAMWVRVKLVGTATTTTKGVILPHANSMTPTVTAMSCAMVGSLVCVKTISTIVISMRNATRDGPTHHAINTQALRVTAMKVVTLMFVRLSMSLQMASQALVMGTKNVIWMNPVIWMLVSSAAPAMVTKNAIKPRAKVMDSAQRNTRTHTAI
mmetsp:Transcript_9380/g.13704  ORF Transcript_9380/g.13704 Transcript_9380/m.13704 type:complete len:220 (+) Transcript_9380:3156-3815(+)